MMSRAGWRLDRRACAAVRTVPSRRKRALFHFPPGSFIFILLLFIIAVILSNLFLFLQTRIRNDFALLSIFDFSLLCFPVFFFFFNISNSNFSTGAKGEKQKVNRKWKVHGIVFKQPTWFRFVYAAVVWQQIFPFFFRESSSRFSFCLRSYPTRCRLLFKRQTCPPATPMRLTTRIPPSSIFSLFSSSLAAWHFFFLLFFFLPMNKKEEKKKFHALTMKTRK